MSKKVITRKQRQIIPTYVPKKPNDLPMFFEKKPYQGASGRLYPLPYSDGITDEKQDVSYEVYTLENEYVKTQVLPAIGGKILRGYDKTGDYDFIYHNEVIKPALVGLAGAWISGGIEFNFPQHHRPTTFMPLEATLEESPDGGATVWTGEVEPFYRMRGAAGITLDPGRSYIKAKIRVYNRTDLPQIFMWWANLAVPVNENTRTIFPPDVEWVNDHDRRAVIEWPIAKGVYKTARPFDYGAGTDLSRYDSVKVPSSFLVSQGQSDMDFVAGYDSGIQKGIVTTADHHIAPGKKMWTWGHGDFGEMWCSNLTDENGPYIELMTGVYTDNQPDFTWLQPYETREFEQYWYAIHDIGDVKNATMDAAMNMEQRGGELFIGFNVTGVFPGCKVLVTAGNGTVFSETVDMAPETAYLKTIPLAGRDFYSLTVSLISADGRTLVSYQPYVRGQKKPIEVRKPVIRPSEMKTVEELYLNGYHLEQYKQHNFDPRDYYREGLRRDPGDIRCNTAMARLALKDGKFDECVNHCDVAIARLTSRNQHPTDTESFYLKGVALCYLGKTAEACDVLHRAGWNYSHRSAAYYKLAALDCAAGRYCDAIEKAGVSYGLNAGHLRARNLEAAALRRLGRKAEAEAIARNNMRADSLDLWSRFEYLFLTGKDTGIAEIFGQKPENFLDVVCDYLEAGLFEDALRVLNLAGNDYPLFSYYRAYCLGQCGREFTQDLLRAAHLETGTCFPSRLQDIEILNFAIRHNPDDSNACYYLGSLYYDRFRYEEAILCWEEAVRREPKHAKALRNLSLAYFDKRGDYASARVCMEKAMEYKPDPRLLFEYQQLLKNSNVSPRERLAVYEKHPDLLAERDDCYLDQIVLLCLQGDYKEAIRRTAVKHFHIYEGGEGNLTKQHAWMHVLYGNELAANGQADEAEKIYHAGVNMPKSYGEAKTFFNQEAHIYYYLGRLLETKGQQDAAQKAYGEASVYKAAVSELSLFRALALRKLSRFSEANAVLAEMLSSGDSLIADKDLRTYYGVGSPCPMPFEYDVEKQNLVNGHILRGYALLGLGKREQAETEIAAAARLDPYNFRIYSYHQIKTRV
ncbi:DUF5107 domain-containing protein [Anaerotruncus rubiinfantis]|uniref:DUF5107 domain-containing protein n=1 Tax=Anaerotruncus rubiinfantis TaxID=1720200 RepID=UPI0034A536F1